ncbi:hypothetical protein [Streptomyces sp. CT34]|uniref:hypothetical protein n=1 Tax=Streptomyces sp. CT34 TaxID=1553907 RepID=UPI0012FF05DF|nr:hypothetical protein [Streptomyces sp. CT34]
MDKILQDAQIKLSSVVSDLFGLSSRAMLDALVAGERNPRTLAGLAQGAWSSRSPLWSRHGPGISMTITAACCACYWRLLITSPPNSVS